MMTFLMLMPAVFMMLLAQLGRRYKALAALTYLGLLLFDMLLVVGGTTMLVVRVTGWRFGELPLEAHLGFMGGTLLATGLVGALLLLPAVQRLLSVFMPIVVGDVVHATALAYTAYMVGFTLAQAPLLQVLENVSEKGVSLPQSELWGQALAMVLLAFVGVGLGVQRSWRATVERLSLEWSGWREMRLAVLATAGLIMLQSLLGAAWMAVSPESFERISRISEALLGQFMNPWGALVVGLTAGVGEELVFRGALQPRFGLLITSAIFALVHVQYAFSFALVIVFILGIVLGILRSRVNTTAAILTHAMYNATLVLLATYASNWVP